MKIIIIITPQKDLSKKINHPSKQHRLDIQRLISSGNPTWLDLVLTSRSICIKLMHAYIYLAFWSRQSCVTHKKLIDLTTRVSIEWILRCPDCIIDHHRIIDHRSSSHHQTLTNSIPSFDWWFSIGRSTFCTTKKENQVLLSSPSLCFGRRDDDDDDDDDDGINPHVRNKSRKSFFILI